MEKKINATEKFCTRCGRKFIPVGREVICPSCKAQAAEETKRMAVLRAKAKSWTGESVPVRISGRASTIIREYGKLNNLPFAEALDALLKSTDYFKSVGQAWEDITPYRSRRRDKAAADKQAAEFLHNKHNTPQEAPQEATKAVKTTNKTSTAKKAVKTVKTAAGKGGKA